MRTKLIVSAVAAAALAATGLTGCISTPQSDVLAGDGPAAATKPAPSKAVSSAGAATRPSQGGSSSDGASGHRAGGKKVASFTDKIIYPDGVEVEVIKHTQAKIGKYAAVRDDAAKAGDPYTVLTIRVKNGTDARLDVFGSATVTYGADGVEAPSVFDEGIEPFDGTVLPDKAKTGTWGFAIPAKYLGDATLEVNFDFGHEPAIFSGSLT